MDRQESGRLAPTTFSRVAWPDVMTQYPDGVHIETKNSLIIDMDVSVLGRLHLGLILDVLYVQSVDISFYSGMRHTITVFDRQYII